jgi:hypothetical protein
MSEFDQESYGDGWDAGRASLEDRCAELEMEIERLQKIIDRCGHKLKVMLKMGQITARAEIDALLAEMTAN